MTMPKRLSYQQRGQAMTEFVVSVSYVFLVLFVIVPTFGKLMDMQAQTQHASRYVAWERTVWFDVNEEPDESVQSSNEWESVATRSDSQVMDSMRNRFFYGSGQGSIKYVTENDIDGAGGDTSPIWRYVQTKESMYGGTTLGSGKDPSTGKQTSLDAQGTPSVAYDIIDIMDGAVSTVMDPLNDLLGVIGVDNDDFMTFAYERENYYSPVITTQVNAGNSMGGGSGVWDTDASGKWGSGIEDAIFQNWDGKLQARSAILADGWNTQSLDHYQERADDFVPSTLFDNDLFDAVITVASFLDGAIGDLEFGEVGIEPMPAAEGQPVAVQCDGGFCYYEE